MRFDKLSSEELFNLFFFGEFPSGRNAQHFHAHQSFRFSGGEEHYRAPHLPIGAVLKLLLPLIIAFFFLFLDSTEQNGYSFERTPTYSVYKETYNHNIPYYVSASANARLRAADLRELEKHIEVDYRARLQSMCRSETERLQARISSALYYGRLKEAETLRGRPLPHCQKLERLESSSVE
ncbi:uncharacterized protein LOC135146128 [Zophobas morio]|uniref:uncharacterized protein LOC135146128 n=1 Tax=Zophobas morio TaxID=2755281 RepID=UPI003083E867